MHLHDYLVLTRRALTAITLRTRDHLIHSDTRKALARISWILRPTKGGPSLSEKIAGIADQAMRYERITGRYLSQSDIVEGRSGDFDCMNLLCWLPIVEQSGVPAVPARTIANLSAEEMGALSGEIPLNFLRKLRIFRMLSDLAREAGLRSQEKTSDVKSKYDLRERAFLLITEAMDNVADNEMVRYARCGGSSLKTIAGAGVAGPSAAPVTFSTDMEVGPGWIRRGNRRMIDVYDARIINCASITPENYVHSFVARPWIRSSRWLSVMDPHREKTPAKGPGCWPAEWRAYICDGKVSGVSAYYSWAHSADKEDAVMALAVEKAAKLIIDTAKAKGVRPAFFDVDDLPSVIGGEESPVRQHPNFSNLERYLAEVPPGGYNCTLDFIETEDGPVFLEAGPPIIPFGLQSGAHPTGFTLGIKLEPFGYPDVHGFALSTPSDLDTTDPQSMSQAPRTGHIFSRAEVEAMASSGDDRAG